MGFRVKRQGKPQQLAGFTLLEILIVLAISSVLLVLVVPNMYNSISGAKLTKTTKQLAATLRHSRLQAINYSRQASFFLNVEQRSYRLSDTPEIFQLPDDLELTLLTGESLLQGDEEGEIRFYQDGSSSGGRITLQLGTRKKQIDINWLTGEVVFSDSL